MKAKKVTKAKKAARKPSGTGRPTIDKGGYGVLRSRVLRLDDDTFRILRRHGDGSASAGARVLARQFRTMTKPGA